LVRRSSMFWKKNSVEHKVAGGAEESSGLDQAEVALDTIASMLRSYGQNAFDTEEVRAAETQSECESWAQKITVGPSRKDGAAGEFKRDFGGVRRYFTAHRARERDYVDRSFSNLRDAVQTFAHCLTKAISEERSSDQNVSGQLQRLTQAFTSNDATAIRKQAETVVELVRSAIQERQRRQAEQVEVLGQKIQKLRDELQQAREQASLDPLTQLHNRSALDSHLERVADLAFLLNSSPCLLMIDVDHFKSVNDKHGHPAGDEVLRKIADALVRQFLRREDFVARFGGEEFVVVIPDSTLQNAKKRAERVREAIQELEIPHQGKVLKVTISVGISCLAEGDAGKSWLARADAALYESKAAGRNRVSVASFPVHSLASLRPSS
ncbi:MAG TPA: GGDEF domain-containing protein, partial [Polyangiaceae bacterium]|nr:GGDEF domain-containing protein [Polyangiaceae bacterium]